jgi:UV DNA damage endonuclease
VAARYCNAILISTSVFNRFLRMSISLLSALHASRSSLYYRLCSSLTTRLSLFSPKSHSSYQSVLLSPKKTFKMPPKRKRTSLAATTAPENDIPPVLYETPIPLPTKGVKPPTPKRQASRRSKIDTNPDHNADIVDGKAALRASPDADEKGEALELEKVNNGPKAPVKTNGTNENALNEDSDSPLSEIDLPAPTPNKKQKKIPTKSAIAAKKGADEIKAFRAEQAAKKVSEAKLKKEEAVDEWEKRVDPDGDDAGPAEDVDVMKREAARPPPVNSDYLPLPWKGRLGYVSFASSRERFN